MEQNNQKDAFEELDEIFNEFECSTYNSGLYQRPDAGKAKEQLKEWKTRWFETYYNSYHITAEEERSTNFYLVEYVKDQVTRNLGDAVSKAEAVIEEKIDNTMGKEFVASMTVLRKEPLPTVRYINVPKDASIVCGSGEDSGGVSSLPITERVRVNVDSADLKINDINVNSIELAYAEHLDNIGAIYGIYRGPIETDSIYRKRLLMFLGFLGYGGQPIGNIAPTNPHPVTLKYANEQMKELGDPGCGSATSGESEIKATNIGSFGSDIYERSFTDRGSFKVIAGDGVQVLVVAGGKGDSSDVCECGKEKHGFASHSTWCKKSEDNR